MIGLRHALHFCIFQSRLYLKRMFVTNICSIMKIDCYFKYIFIFTLLSFSYL